MGLEKKKREKEAHSGHYKSHIGTPNIGLIQLSTPAGPKNRNSFHFLFLLGNFLSFFPWPPNYKNLTPPKTKV